MDSKSTPESAEKEVFSKPGAGLSRDSENHVKTRVFDAKSNGVGKGLSAFFESLPSLEANLDHLSDSEHDSKNSSKTPVFELNSNPTRRSSFSHRSKSSLRIRYDAEVLLIKRKIGDLEYIRQTLGLTQRKMCQLLLVDPSAWTRWTKKGEDAPPHIYRSLQWYLALQEKYPALDVGFWLSTVARTDESTGRRHEEKMAALGDEFAGLTSEIKSLQEELSARTSEMRKRIQELESERSAPAVRKKGFALFAEEMSDRPGILMGVLAMSLGLGFFLAWALLK